MFRLRFVTIFACLIVVCAFTLSISAAQTKNKQRALVITNDGKRLQGILVKQDKKKIVLTVSGINMILTRSDIHTIKKLPSLEQVYKQRSARLESSDINGRYRLAYFMYAQGAYNLALSELNSLENKFPNNAKVKALKQIIINRQTPSKKPTTRPTTRPTTPPASQPSTKPSAKTNKNLPVSLNRRLTQKQINRIKVYEIDLTTRPQVRIPYHTIVAFFRKYVDASDNPSTAQSRREFRELPGYKQLSEFFSYRARNLYGQVEVAGDSPALETFHRRIQTSYVTNYCGTTKCHGGFKSPGKLYLFQAQPVSATTTYTNFYILNQYQNQDGKMINRREPKLSLLVQYGMSRDIAKTPHPKVKGWRPLLRSRRSPRYKLLLEFIDGLYKPAPNYGIDYQIPLPKKNTNHKKHKKHEKK